MSEDAFYQLSPDGPDAAGVMALLQDAFAYMDGRISPPSSLHRLSEDGIRNQCHTGEVWLSGAPPVACVFLTPRPDRLYIGKMAVAPGAQGRGLGRAMMRLAEQRARALELDLLELQTRVELVENHAAFARLGFREVRRGTHTGFTEPTFLVMQKPIAPLAQ